MMHKNVIEESTSSTEYVIKIKSSTYIIRTRNIICVPIIYLSSATQHTMSTELGRKWRTKSLNTKSPLPTRLCAGYSVKLIYLFIYKILF